MMLTSQNRTVQPPVPQIRSGPKNPNSGPNQERPQNTTMKKEKATITILTPQNYHI
jgi:hypothetical protein